MKFFEKGDHAAFEGATYRQKGDNRPLREALFSSQRGFCAYSEIRIQPEHTTAVEHFDPTLKGSPDDGYTNWYGVLQRYNQLKRTKEVKHTGASFFASRFFQTPGGFDERVGYLAGDFVYEPRREDDAEAHAFIDYLSLSSAELAEARCRQVRRLREIFDLGEFTDEEKVAWFRDFPADLSYVTVLEAELGLDLSDLVASVKEPVAHSASAASSR